MHRIKNLEIWIITLIAVIIFLFGIFYYEILGSVVNVAAFIVSLTIIILILILVIIFSHEKNRKDPHFEKLKVETGKTKTEKQKYIVKKNSSKKLKVSKKIKK